MVAGFDSARGGFESFQENTGLANDISTAFPGTTFTYSSTLTPSFLSGANVVVLGVAVNDELGSLTALLRNLPSCLKPGGRVAILSFHSGEDRRVKSALHRRPLTPSLPSRGGGFSISRGYQRYFCPKPMIGS